MESSALSRLSAELRNEIYHNVLVTEVPIVLQRPIEAFRTSTKNDTQPLPGLLQSCRGIREEALKMYYAANTFEIRCHAWQPTLSNTSPLYWIYGWLNAIGPACARALTSVNIDLGAYSEVFGKRKSLYPNNLEMLQRLETIAPDLASLTVRIPPDALFLSSLWSVQQVLPGPAPVAKTGLMAMRKMQIFRQGRGVVLPFVRPGQEALSNTRIHDIFSACLVGNGRAALIMLIHATWLHLARRSASRTTHDDFDAGRISLESAFRAIDDESTIRAMSILPDEFRGYPVGIELYENALDHVDHFESWILDAENGDD